MSTLVETVKRTEHFGWASCDCSQWKSRAIWRLGLAGCVWKHRFHAICRGRGWCPGRMYDDVRSRLLIVFVPILETLPLSFCRLYFYGDDACVRCLEGHPPSGTPVFGGPYLLCMAYLGEKRRPGTRQRVVHGRSDLLVRFLVTPPRSAVGSFPLDLWRNIAGPPVVPLPLRTTRTRDERLSTHLTQIVAQPIPYRLGVSYFPVLPRCRFLSRALVGLRYGGACGARPRDTCTRAYMRSYMAEYCV